jgi:hypothetical protein
MRQRRRRGRIEISKRKNKSCLGRRERRGHAREREGVAADYELPADVMLKRPLWKTGCIQVPRAAIAQLGERQTEDLKVPGSIPGLGIAHVNGHAHACTDSQVFGV